MINRDLQKEIAKHFGLFVLIIILGLAGGIAAIAQAKYLTDIVNGVFLDGLGLQSVVPWIYFLLLAIVLRALLNWVADLLGFRLATIIKNDLQKRLWGKLISLGPVYVERQQIGELVNTLVEGIEDLEVYFTKYVPQLVVVMLLLPVILAVAFSLDTATGIIMIITAPLIPLFMLLIGRWADSLQRRQWSGLNRLSGHFFDVIKGLTTLKVFGRSKEQADVVFRLSEQFRDSTLRVLKVAFSSALVLELLTTLSTALVAVIVALKLLSGNLSFSQAFFVLLLAPEFYQPLRHLGSNFHAGLAGKIAAEQIYRILTSSEQLAANTDKRAFATKGSFEIKFEQVDYAYPQAVRPAIRSLSLCIKPGERVAIVGPSGAGKSTMVDLMLGFIKADSGFIKVDGHDINNINLSEWLNQVTYVPQFPYLFCGTVCENILFGSGGDYKDAEKAAIKAGAHEFIRQLPDGYDTLIGEGGVGLSGGEAQRIAIARAFCKKAPILILDEATTGLDYRNESAVRNAVTELMIGKTVLIIAHRLSTAAKADRIIVMDEGSIVEVGNHEELLAKQGLYYRLVGAYRRAV